jgi:hypothetical protein
LFTASNPSKQADSGFQKGCLFLWIVRLPSVHPLECNVEARNLWYMSDCVAGVATVREETYAKDLKAAKVFQIPRLSD